MSLRNQDERELSQMEKSYLSQLDTTLLQAGDIVARLAVQLAKADAKQYSQSLNLEGALPEAWKLLRRACLEIDTTGKKRTVEDYARFGIRPPKELVEASKPPPPPPHREPFDTLFNKAQNTIYLPSTPVEGLIEKFEWRQLTPWDANTQHLSEERKTRPYQIAWAVIDSRVREGIGKFCDESFVNQLCFGFEWEWNWEDLPLWTAKRSEQTTGIFDPWVNSEEWEILAKCAAERPRPHNRSVRLPWVTGPNKETPQPELCPDFDKGLPGPTPPDGTSVEALYEQAKTWAEAVLEAWKKELVQLEFDVFWRQGKQQGFLWNDVQAMALHTKKHKGGIKWHSGTGPPMPSVKDGENVEAKKRKLGRMWRPRDFNRENVGW